MNRSIILLLSCLWLIQCANGIEREVKSAVEITRDSLIADSMDQSIFKEKWHLAATIKGGLRTKTLALMRSFVGTPYGIRTLDQCDTERLVINLRTLDCWTSVECCLAIALISSDLKPDYERYQNQVQNLRYHNGIIEGYGSRIHYFCDWILQNETKGYFRDITSELGGIPYVKNITYITDAPAYYTKANNPVAQQKIHTAQLKVTAHKWHYFPKQNVASIESKIQEGDIIVFTSAIPNLDVQHQGFAIKQQGRIHLLHASSSGKKVMISPKPLPNYLADIAQLSGIIVIRIMDNQY
jgi:hypothetical protein